MINEELYINDVLVELKGKSTIAVTRQANQLGELQNRQADYSNVFELPKTATNRATFENADQVNSSTDIPYRRLSARYVVDGIDQLQDGEAIVVRTTANAFFVKVQSGNASFFGKFPDMKISELIGSAFDHVNNFANVTASRSNTTGYIYPFIDWEETDETAFTTKDVNADRLLPCIFVKDVFQLVDEYTGYDSYGAFIDLPDFENLIVAPNNLERGDGAKEAYNTRALITTDQSVLVGIANGTTTSKNFVPTITDFEGNFNGATFTGDEGLYGYFTLSGALTLTYKRFEFVDRSIIIRVQIKRVSDGLILEQEEIFNQLAGLDPSESEVTVELVYNVISSNHIFAPGEQYRATFYIQDTQKCEVVVREQGEFRFNLEPTTPYGAYMATGDLFQGLTVKQLYQDILNQYAVTPLTNSLQRRVRFGLFRELLDSISTAPDWSSKVMGKDYELTYLFGKYGKRNHLKYAPDDTVLQGYGDSYFTLDNETVNDEVTAVQLNTSATEDEVRFQNQIYPRIKSLDVDRECASTNYRILLLDRKDTGYTHRYVDGVDTLEVSNNIPYATFRPLNFEVLRDTYYEALLQMLFKTKTPTYKMKLTSQDMQELDHLQAIYLDVHNGDINVTGFFYVNVVANYVNGFASVSLVRI